MAGSKQYNRSQDTIFPLAQIPESVFLVEMRDHLFHLTNR